MFDQNSHDIIKKAFWPGRWGWKSATYIWDVFEKGAPELTIRYSPIKDTEMKAMAEALKCNQTLKTMNLFCTDMDNSRATVLASALVSNKALTKLALGKNSIGGDGAYAIARALKRNETLEELDLSNNNIGDDGARALAMMLEINRTLTRLDLSSNWIDTAGARALAEALRVNTTLVWLDMGDNPIGDSNRPRSPVLDDIARRLEANTQRTPPASPQKQVPSPLWMIDIAHAIRWFFK